MAAFVKWLLRQRDQCSVSYSRFGVPGDPVEDRPPPTEIYVAGFDDDHPDFKYLGICHVQKAAVLSAGFGMSFVVLMFISAFFEFDWYSHESGVDVIALLLLLAYLSVGVLIHYEVIMGIRRKSPQYLVPFLIVYTMVMASEVLLASYKFNHINIKIQLGIRGSENLLILAIALFVVVIFIQGNMVAAVARCRLYLSRKRMHEIALKVAERSKEKNPALRIVITSANSVSSNPHANSVSAGMQDSNGGPPPSYAEAAAVIGSSVENRGIHPGNNLNTLG